MRDGYRLNGLLLVVCVVIFCGVCNIFLVAMRFEKRKASTQPVVEVKTERWMSVTGNLYIGTKLYDLRNDAYRGEVLNISEARIFPNGIVSRAVLVRFPDGVCAWYPRGELANFYKTKAE